MFVLFFFVVGTVPKFGSALFRNIGDTAHFYTGPTFQMRTALISDVLTRLFQKLELSTVYTYVDFVYSSYFSTIYLKIAKLKNLMSILLTHNIRLFIEKQVLKFEEVWRYSPHIL